MKLNDLPPPANEAYDLPDASGHFGPYGGIFVSETLMHALDELKRTYAHYRTDPEFMAEFESEPVVGVSFAP